MIDSYQLGTETPNPDVACNKYIKFGHFANYVRERLGIDTIATGHYARVFSSDRSPPLLLQASDLSKDQSYFLSTTQVLLFHSIFTLPL